MTKRKKGFTIVELVIVIAVIGILAGILIPTFANLIHNANVASDGALIRELNNALASDLNQPHETIYDALNATDNFGFNVQKINAQARNNKILWDSKNDVFCYLQDGVIEYQNTSIKNADKLAAGDYRLWICSKTVDDTYSTYLYNYNGNKDIVTTKGLDTSDSTNAGKIDSVKYDRHDATVAQNVVIRTNGEALTIDAPLDNVKHYGEASSLNVIAVAGSSYRENGKVAFVEISKGRIVLEASSEVNHIHVNAKTETTFDTVIIAKEANVEMPTLSRDDVEIASQGTLVVALQNGTEEVNAQSDIDYVWLTKQGIYEQIKVSNSATNAGNVWVNTSNKPAETKEAAQQIANNIGLTATVGAQEYNVSVNEDRDIVLTTTNEVTGLEEVAYTITADNSGNTVIKDAENNEVAEEVAQQVQNGAVEAQPDKENVQIGVTLFSGGTGSEKDPYLIYNSIDFSNISKITKSEKVWYKLVNNITYDVTNIGNYNYVAEMINGDLDLNGKILSISTDNTNMIIGVGTYAKVHNGTINMNGDIALFDEMNYSLQATLVVDSVDFTGSVTPGGWGPHYGVIDCYAGNTSNNKTIVTTVVINNVNSWVNIKANATCVGGLLGYCLRANVSITNTNVYSYIESGYGAGGIIMSDTQVCGYETNATAIAAGQTWGTVENVKFHGNILVPEGKNAYYFGRTIPAGQDSDYAGSSAALVKGINIDNDILVAENGEFKINTNSNYTRYVVRYSFSVDYLDDRAGGYPRVIEKELLNNGEQTISTGIYKNKVKEGTFNPDTDTYVTDGSNGIFTRAGEAETYYYDGIGTYKLSKYGVTVTVYAYNGTSLKAVGSYSYPKN